MVFKSSGGPVFKGAGMPDGRAHTAEPAGAPAGCHEGSAELGRLSDALIVKGSSRPVGGSRWHALRLRHVLILIWRPPAPMARRSASQLVLQALDLFQ